MSNVVFQFPPFIYPSSNNMPPRFGKTRHHCPVNDCVGSSALIALHGYCKKHQWVCEEHKQVQTKKEPCKTCVVGAYLTEKREKEAALEAEREADREARKRSQGMSWGDGGHPKKKKTRGKAAA